MAFDFYCQLSTFLLYNGLLMFATITSFIDADDLHCTSIVADSEAFPHGFIASHLYSPASLLLIFLITNSVPFVRSPLLVLTQNTVGGGIPVAGHDKFKFSPSVITSLEIGVMNEGTERTAKNHSFSMSSNLILRDCFNVTVIHEEVEASYCIHVHHHYHHVNLL